MFLIVGLGNPEKKYTHTRHNAGFLAIDGIAKRLNASWKKKSDLFSEVSETHIEGEKIVLAKPQTYMNESGKAVAALAHRFHVEPQHIIVLSDDVALAVGTVRVRTEGSSGGHNGLKSIIAHMSTQQFPRVRIGVGAQPPHIALENWVLSSFLPEEMRAIEPALTKAGEVALDIARGTMHPQTHTAPPSSSAS